MIFLKIADVVRAYCREVENLSDQLRGFRFDDAVAHCCSVGHIDPSSGSPILCDREIVRRCIIKWFGSVGEFEATVRTEVLDILFTDLSAALVSYRRIVEASPVVLWVFLDFSLLPMRASIDQGIWLLLRGVTYWLAVIPTLFVVMYTLAHLTRRERRSRCLDKLVSVLLVCVGIGFLLGPYNCFIESKQTYSCIYIYMYIYIYIYPFLGLRGSFSEMCFGQLCGPS